MSLHQGQDHAAGFVPPQRTPVEFDPESNGLRIGPYERRIADPSDPDQVLGAYLSLLYAVRGAQPGEQLKLRSADLEALLAIVGDDPDTIEQRLIALMGCTAQEARVLGFALLRHRRLTATLGVAGALAMSGVIAGDDFLEGPSSDAPRAAVVQSVAAGLRALDDAGASRGSVAAVSPASVAMPTDDWIGSTPVGGPDAAAGTPAEGGAAPAVAAPAASAPSDAAPAGQAPSAGDVPGGTPAAPAAAAPAVEVPAAAPAAEAPAVTVQAVPVVPAPVLESVVDQPSRPSPVDTTPVDTTPVDTTPVDTTPVDTTAPVVTTPVDMTTPVDDDGDAAGRDDNGKHGQTGQHVENGNGKSNSAGGAVP